MSRRKIRGFIKQPVERILIAPAVQSQARICIEVDEGTGGAIPVTQDDGSTKFFVVQFKVTTPEVVKFRALGPTTSKAQRNDVKNMAPKGGKMSKTGPQSGGKR